MGEALGGMLSAAVGVAISPVPIIAVILMLFSQHAARNGGAFVLGRVCGLTAVGVVVLVFVSPTSISDDGPTVAGSIIRLVLGLLLLSLAWHSWLKRPSKGEEAPQPEWMAGIDAYTAPKAWGLGFALSAANPKDLLLAISAAVAVAGAGMSGVENAVAWAGFVLIPTATVLALLLFLLLAPRRAESALMGWKEWLSQNNAVVIAVTLLVIGVKLVGDGIGGLL